MCRVFDGSDEQVHHLGEHGVGVQFHPVGGILADLPGKTAHDGLEELVDGTDGEAGIVVQHPLEPVGRQGRPPVVAARKLVERIDDARFHLIGRLVGEGDGQDMLVGLRIAREQQVDVVVREPVGLAASRRCLDNAYSLLHSRLKLQYLHTVCSGSPSLPGRGSKGSSGLKISSISASRCCSNASSDSRSTG